MVAHVDEAASALGNASLKRRSGRRSGRRISLRNLLFIAFVAIAIIPVGLLSFWTQRSAYEKELAEVSERHLLIARNLSYALERYSHDVVSVFRKATMEMQAGTSDAGMIALLQSMGFDHTCIIGPDGAVQSAIVTPEGGSAAAGLPDPGSLRDAATASLDQPVFTSVMALSDGTPRMFLVHDIGDGSLAVGSIQTDYLIKLQKAIAFGDKGHSAIVDATGRVLAHPSETWRLERKDISAILPVERMLAGETGVATFYSPALQADMIAGYTIVPTTGWGVMVPQPIAELEAHANRVQAAAIYIGLLGMAIAVLLAWMLSRYLARPIEEIAGVTRSVEAGDTAARVADLPSMTPAEITTLATSVNQMLTQLERSAEQLRDKAEEADSANRAKSRFLANMSHEFRTPLSAIIGYSDIMRDEIHGPLGGDGNYHEYAESMREAGNHILGMVNEILLLTRAEAGHLELHPNRVDVADCVRFAVAMIERTADSNKLTVSTSIAAGLSELWTDDGKLRQILLNLVSNAAKFTNPGGSITISADTDPAWAVILKVSDTGIGIRPQDIPKVMQPFGQVDDTYDRNHGGTGLGLPLTRELVSLMGGEFELKSTPGVGTEAVVRLPLRAPLSEDATTRAETAQGQ